MKVDYYLNGVYQGQKEVSDDSLIGSLSRGDMAKWAEKARLLKEELESLGCTVTIEKAPSNEIFLR